MGRFLQAAAGERLYLRLRTNGEDSPSFSASATSVDEATMLQPILNSEQYNFKPACLPSAELLRASLVRRSTPLVSTLTPLVSALTPLVSV
eukprot:5297947-Pyramimonas_sp.AAC.1